ncbi:MAG TPA: HPr(Ser) kinase/phosphatase [Spirochaetota bacterium]|nr:HPr(Ser) kinase/phosphatase [Spirochaetota bacterium]HRZ27055.1 HPr(Ser) kinase/phosphatase [Spirochaetota bacterium]HSA14706.1 HPr(Ser) kinase/phosphatase [Spirochaetota bacterium]
MGQKIRISDFLKNTGRVDLRIRLIAGSAGVGREIENVEINRPGLTLAGFYDFFAYDRIQIFGLGEAAYMKQLSDEEKNTAYGKFFSYDVLCCIFTHDEEPDRLFIDYANNKNVPVFVTSRSTTRFVSIFTHLLDEVFSQSVTLHGTLVAVYGIGILILGKSGVGKSETALELIERGHRLVADDMVEVKKIDESLLMGSGSPILRHHMEIRGLGIINVRDIFGIGSVRNRKRVELVALLEEWDSAKEYDRLGMEEQMYSILDLDVPFLTIPVRPGRNIPIIIETAALNQRLKKMGIYSARELDEKIQNWIRSEKELNG